MPRSVSRLSVSFLNIVKDFEEKSIVVRTEIGLLAPAKSSLSRPQRRVRRDNFGSTSYKTERWRRESLCLLQRLVYGEVQSIQMHNSLYPIRYTSLAPRLAFGEV